MSESRISTDNLDVAVTWDTAQAILATFAQAGLNNLGKGSIRVNARNSGNPNDTEEAREWQETQPPFKYFAPVAPGDFEAMQSPVALSDGQHQLHGADGVGFNWNSEYRMLALVLVGTHPVVIPFDKMLDVTVAEAAEFAAKKLKEYNDNNVAA